jgi:hypothetical protein
MARTRPLRDKRPAVAPAGVHLCLIRVGYVRYVLDNSLKNRENKLSNVAYAKGPSAIGEIVTVSVRRCANLTHRKERAVGRIAVTCEAT